MAEVHLTRRALLDIEEIDLYSMERWGDKVAAQYLADLYAGAALALRAAVMDLPNRIAELEPQLIYEAELLARQIKMRRAGE